MQSSTRRPKRILLIVEMCNPTWTSVPLVGYNMARALAERPELEITLVTHIRNYEAMKNDPICSKAEVHFIDNEWLARPAYNLTKRLRGGDKLAWTLETAMSWPSYMVFEFLLHRQFAQDFDRKRFDLIHRLTPLSPTIPSPLAGRTKTPMIIGPLNGGLPWPKDYPELISKEKEWLVPLRQFYRLLPFYRRMYQELVGVIAGSKHTATEVPRFFRGKRFYLPENGVDPVRFPLASGWPQPQGSFQFIMIGRLVPYKGTDLTLEAIAKSPTLRKTRFLICGDGPERPKLEAYVNAQGLRDTVRFSGWIDNKILTQELARSQAFVFPSLREFGGGVVVEAMSAGVPPVIVDYGGPAELVTPDSGILLPMAPRHELVPKLQAAMESLVHDPLLCQRLGENAVENIRKNYLWSAKAEKMLEIYRELE